MTKQRIGFCINYQMHSERRWVSALTYYLVEAIINEFNPIIIQNQSDYEHAKNSLTNIISMEVGWAAPKIEYGINHNKMIAMFVSDPHNKINWLEKYVEDNSLSYVYSYYEHPFFYHFPKFPPEKFIHLPWAIPDKLLSPKNRIVLRNNGVAIFGGKKSDAYDIRNWCRNFDFVTSYDYSGVENKVMSDQEYFHWLSTLDAIIAAGSSNPAYDLVTPKYFEILSSGALLIGQYCKDLKILGINSSNSIVFTKDTFKKSCIDYLKFPKKYKDRRTKGLSLIASKHLISHRIKRINDSLR